ncbi:YbbR-like domain-containing protein [Flavobacteriaceae bacterium 3-367]|uniref:CdaR family protein n=1 Tax=Eudoraea algarum TaxID=3417568 RepID=UPI00328787EB
MITRIRKGLSKRKVKIFLLFLISSFLAWFISNLSESYEDRATFQLEYINVPDSLFLTRASKNEIEVQLRANGFQFLWFNFSPKRVKVNLSAMGKRGNKYFVLHDSYKNQIERQLSGSMRLLDVDRDTLFFQFFKVYSKEVPVKPVIELNLAQNHLLDGKLVLDPDKITITGPKNEIDTILVARTEALILPELNSDFSHTLNLNKPEMLENTSYSQRTIQISGKVSRFSERIIEVPVQVINVPEGAEIKTFPNVVSLLCKAKIGQLKDLSAADFQLLADYERAGNSKKILQLVVGRQPEGLHSVRLLETQVEYILKRE